MTERKVRVCDVVVVVIVECCGANVFVELPFDMPAAAFVAWLGRSEMDVCQLDNDLKAALAEVLAKVQVLDFVVLSKSFEVL